MKSIPLKKFIEEHTPKGMEYDPDNSTPENIVFREKAINTRWEDLGGVSGYFTSHLPGVYFVKDAPISPENKNVYATEAQCEAHLAQAQLTQIIKRVNGNWEPDWADDKQVKSCIVLCKGEYETEDIYTYHSFLAFKSKEIAEQVLRQNQDLLEQYKPLAG